MVVDFHTHCFPAALAAHALEVLSSNAGGKVPIHDGTVEGALQSADRAGVDRFVVLNIPTKPGQMKAVNDFAASVNGGRVVSFGGVHPQAPGALDELSRIHDLGLQGIKLHPEYQDFFVDDPAVFPLYERAAKLGLIVSFHAGWDLWYFDPCHCTPQALSRALPALDGAAVVAAHLGGYHLWTEVEEHLVGRDLYFDTSQCYGCCPRYLAERIIGAHGVEKILFGSDSPWVDPALEMRYVNALGLTEGEKALILGGNAARLLGIEKG